MKDKTPGADGYPISPAAYVGMGVVGIVLGVFALRDDQGLLGLLCLLGGAGTALYGIIAGAVAAGVKSARDDDATP